MGFPLVFECSVVAKDSDLSDLNKLKIHSLVLSKDRLSSAMGVWSTALKVDSRGWPSLHSEGL